eukprot:5548301-Prymnesium_polylepis.1
MLVCARGGSGKAGTSPLCASSGLVVRSCFPTSALGCPYYMSTWLRNCKTCRFTEQHCVRRFYPVTDPRSALKSK